MNNENNYENRPLSLGQQALWFLHKFSNDQSAYNINLAWSANGNLSIQKIKSCIHYLTQRHDSLRSNFFTSSEGELFQRCNNASNSNITVIDAHDWSDDKLKNAILQSSKKCFNLESDLLWRWDIYQRSNSTVTLHCSVHHIAIDQWSIVILMNELDTLYRALEQKNATSFEKSLEEFGKSLLGPVDNTSYQKFVCRQEKLIDSHKGEKLGKYWAKQLKDSLDPLNIPTDYPRGNALSYRGGRITIPIADSLASDIEQTAASANTNLFSFYLAAYQLLLNNYTAQQTILTSSPTAGRRPSDKSAVGYFVNPIIIKGELSGEISFFDFLQKLQKTSTTAIMHRDYPFIKIVEDLKINRITNRSPITSISFAWNQPESFGQKTVDISLDKHGHESWKIAGLDWQRLDIRAQEDDFDLFMTVSQIKGKIAINLEFNKSLFCEETIKRFLQHYQQLLKNIVSAPSKKLSEIEILTQREKLQFYQWNAERSDLVKRPQCAHQYVEQIAEINPNSPAVISGDKTLNYEELNTQANQLAVYLNEKGVKRNDLLAVCINKCTELIVAILGVLKAGAAYVPIDPNYPQDRIDYILEDSNCKFVITLSSIKTPLRESSEHAIILDQLQDKINELPCKNLNLGDLQDLSYIIYTSGSTGRPKGVALNHRGLCSLFQFAKETYTKEELSGVLAAASINFDLHVYEILVPLALGGCIILAENALYLSSIESRDKVTMFTTVPSAIKALLQINGIPKSVTTINLGGEPVNNNIVQAVYALDNIQRIYNLYGPSEDTFLSTFYLTKKNAEYEPYIGKPINETQCYILDKYNRAVPIGVTGELCIGGQGLAKEYINQEKLTSSKFIKNPLFNDASYQLDKIASASIRLYKTGDLARFHSNGFIELLGRADYQVKIRGFRIELGEIESCLDVHPRVREAVVLAQENKQNDKVLIAYIVTHDSAPTDSSEQELETELSAYLKSKLPEYMVPSHYIFLDKLPLSPNGKVERQALKPYQEKAFDRREGLREKRRSDLSGNISAVWEEVLGLENISIHANFFDIGGHSLLMVQVYTKLKDILPPSMKLVDLYQYPTIHALENKINEKTRTKNRDPHKSRQASTPKMSVTDTRIAIIGIACKYPGANNAEEFWDNIKNGKDCIKTHSLEEIINSGVEKEIAENPNYVKRSGSLEGIEFFDAEFFKMGPKEAQITDPQQRLFLTCCWEAMEDAAIVPDREDSGLIGIFAGSGQNSYYQNHLSQNTNLLATIGSYQLMLANEKDFLCSRAAYKLNTLGPTLNIQTACSTSLSATHVACQSLNQRIADVAIAGGVSLSDLKKGYLYQEGMILSPDGFCKPFDENAQGTVPSQGVGVVVLKRFKDAITDKNHIYATIEGSAINNDGAHKAGYTAPAIEGQARVLQSALKHAGITPDVISYIETHGTATPVGDPIEIRALSKVYNRAKAAKKSKCFLGAVKSNIGHTDAAAGVAGLIKTAMSLHTFTLPPTLHFNRPNSDTDLDNSHFEVNTTLQPWLTHEKNARYAGVSSFGLGGTNAHIILKEYRSPEKTNAGSPTWQLIPLTAQSEAAIQEVEARLLDYLKRHPHVDIADISYTLTTGRKHFPYRKFYISKTTSELIEQLENPDEFTDEVLAKHNETKAPVVFMFPGGGSQYQGMAAALYENLYVYRNHADSCIKSLKDNHPGLFELYNESDLLGLNSNVNETLIFHPSLFILEYSLAKTLMHFGITPDLLIGHSLGEYAAACLAKTLSLSDAMFLVIKRAQLASSLPAGAMLSIKLSEASLREILPLDLEISLVNSSHRCTVSGDRKSIEVLYAYCNEHEIEARILPMSQGFHSKALDPILDNFRSAFQYIDLNAPQRKIVSTVSGNYLDSKQMTNPDYWVNHLRQTNRFADGIKTILADHKALCCIDLGPNKVVATLTRQHEDKLASQRVFTVLKHVQDDNDDYYYFIKFLASYWADGHEIEWQSLNNQADRLISLPTYPFELKRYWAEPQPHTKLTNDQAKSASPYLSGDHPNTPETSKTKDLTETEQSILTIWKSFLGHEDLSLSDDFFELGGDSLMAIRLVNTLKESFKCELDTHILIKHPTIKKLAKAIECLAQKTDRHTTSSTSTSQLINLKQGTTEKNWFLIHPGGGHLYFYNDLIQAFDPAFNIFGIQARGCDGKSQPINQLTEMAEIYVEIIQRQQADGPYYIGGSSFGGLVAFEIARILKTRGFQVPLIFMVDSPGPGQMMKRFETKTDIIRHFFTDLDLTYETLISAENDVEKQVNYILEVAKKKGLMELLPPGFGSHFIQMIAAHLKAMYNYIPSKYDGNILFFRHTESMEDYSDYPELAWIPLVGGGVRVCPVPGNHLTMNFSPNVLTLVKQLNATLVELQEQKS